MREAEIEKYLKLKVEANGGLCLKFVSPSSSGVPDRLIIFPKGKICFVELKAPGKKLKPLQRYWAERLQAYRHEVKMIDSKADIDAFIAWADGYDYL